MAQGRAAGLPGDRALPLGRAPRAGVPVLRAAYAAADVDGDSRHVLPVADEDRGAALWIRAGDADRPLGAAQRIHGHVVQVVDGVLLDTVLSPLRARHPVLPGQHPPLLVWREG